MIDAFSWKIFCLPLRSKKALAIKTALNKIFDSIHTPITKIESDSGGEFIGNAAFFKDKKILFSTKHSQHKAALAEHAIYEVKRKLYLMMNSYNTKNWVKLLPSAVKLLNARPMARNNGISPDSFSSMYDDVLKEDAAASKKEISQNSEKAEEVQLPLNSYVYLDKKRKTLEKSFGPQVRRVFFPLYVASFDSFEQ